MVKALELHNDQARSAEREIAPGLGLVIGIRNIYINNDGEISVVQIISAG